MVLAVASIMLTSVGLTPAPALAGTWYGATGKTGCNSPNEADNKAHYFYMADLSRPATKALRGTRLRTLLTRRPQMRGGIVRTPRVLTSSCVTRTTRRIVAGTGATKVAAKVILDSPSATRSRTGTSARSTPFVTTCRGRRTSQTTADVR